MNRRQFTTSLSALFAAPALPIKAITAAPAATTAIPNAARFWAIYMSQLHGTCSAGTLATMTGVNTATAQGYLTRMIGDGVITPTDIIRKAINAQTSNAKPSSQWKERVQKFVDDKNSNLAATKEDVTEIAAEKVDQIKAEAEEME
jgi:DNA-binding transcriptional regulator YhcF (GntR family)